MATSCGFVLPDRSTFPLRTRPFVPGSPVLFVAGTNQWDTAGEYEVMVNLDTQYLIRGRGVLRHVYYNGRRAYDARVTDVIIAK
jgi:hypothetical protein